QAGTYAITAAIGSLAAVNYKFTFVNGTLTVNQEDASIQYTGDTIAQVSTTLSLRATVWDSAAAGYAGANPETSGGTIGDITKMWIAFEIWTTGLSPTLVTTTYGQVVDTGAAG